MRTTRSLILACFSVLSCLSLQASDQWNMFQANPAHTGYIPISINRYNIALRWTKKVGSALNPITAGEGKIYLSVPAYSNTQYLYAIHKNGDFAWGKSFVDVHSVNPPSYSGGKVYVQIGAGSSSAGPALLAYQASGGKVIFLSNFAAQWENYMSPTIYNGQVYINGGTYGGMYSFRGDRGGNNWFFGRLPQIDEWTPAVDKNHVYCVLEGTFYAVDRLTGKLDFTIPGANGNNPVPMLGENHGAFVIDGGMLTKFDTQARKIAWQNIFDIRENYVGQPALAKGLIYAGTSQGRLVALSERTGAVVWSTKVAGNDSIQNNIVITNTHAFLGNSNNVYAVDLLTKRVVWTYPASGSLALAESRFYIASPKGKLTAFDLGIPDLHAPDSVSFSASARSNSATKVITLTNVGDRNLNIGGIDCDSSAFQLRPISSPITLSPGMGMQVTITFNPTGIGFYKGKLRIQSTDPNEPEVIVRVRGVRTG